MTILSVVNDSSKALFADKPLNLEDNGDCLFATPVRATKTQLSEMGADLAAADNEIANMERDLEMFRRDRKAKVRMFAATKRQVIERETIGQDESTHPWRY